jgi:hypothetical protein
MPNRQGRWKPAAVVLSLLGTLLLATSVPGAASAAGRGPSNDLRSSISLDAASSAIPTTARTAVTDSANATAVLEGQGRKAVATAVATSGCDGCSGTATTFQTVLVKQGGAAIADNVATAWSSCSSCSSSAVSVQIITGPSASSVEVNNRSLALNAGCTACTTTAVALQFLVIGGSQRELSGTTKALIQQIEQDLGIQLAGKSVHRDQAQKAADDAGKRAKSAIATDLRPGDVSVRVELKTGN